MMGSCEYGVPLYGPLGHWSFTTKIVNVALKDGVVPDALREALLKPVLK